MIERIASWENLALAYRRASRGKRGRPGVAAFEHRLEDALAGLREELLARRYVPGRYRSFVIHEPKRRLISAAPFRDRVVHHALCNLTAPRLERTLVADSFANRVGMGTHRALACAQRLARRHRYVLQVDVRRFFPSIDHAILRAHLARRIDDANAMWLVDRILSGGAGVLAGEYRMVYFRGDDLLAACRPRGLPIGNLTSQLWANVYLSPVDHYVKRELGCRGYVRYVDDLLLFGDDKRAVRAWLCGLIERAARLRLTLHAGGHARPVTEGFPFLGFVVYPHLRRLKRRKVVAFRRRLRALLAGHAAGVVAPETVAAVFSGWFGHARHGDTAGLRRALLAGLPGEVRDCLAPAIAG